jgi:hypothetical protein
MAPLVLTLVPLVPDPLVQMDRDGTRTTVSGKPVRMLYRFSIFPRLAKCHEIVGQANTTHNGVLDDLLVSQSDRFRSCSGDEWVFPDAEWRAMEDKSLLLERPDDVAGEVPKPDLHSLLFVCGQMHAMNGHYPSRQHNTLKLFYQEPEMLKKFLVRLGVSHVPRIVTV